jgi:hypothetical protein
MKTQKACKLPSQAFTSYPHKRLQATLISIMEEVAHKLVIQTAYSVVDKIRNSIVAGISVQCCTRKLAHSVVVDIAHSIVGKISLQCCLQN